MLSIREIGDRESLRAKSEWSYQASDDDLASFFWPGGEIPKPEEHIITTWRDLGELLSKVSEHKGDPVGRATVTKVAAGLLRLRIDMDLLPEQPCNSVTRTERGHDAK